MIITRDIINKNILFNDINQVYDFVYLDKLIDAYKNLLQSKGAKQGKTIVIGTQASIYQIALIFACAELGLIIVIVGTPLPKGKVYNNPSLVDPKLKLLLPIDFFIVWQKTETLYYETFKACCQFTIVIDEELLDYTPNKSILAQSSNTLIKCTSSGTTNTPKVITHTHEFLYTLSKRNSIWFDKKMGMMTNLAHGSSLAVFFLPGLMSNNVLEYYNFPNREVTELAKLCQTNNIELNHLLVPYTLMLDNFFSTDVLFKECIMYTLGIIRKGWVDKINKGQAKDIISIFGTNETSGPFLINQASNKYFHENGYKLIDDFYNVEVNDKGSLIIGVPIYNKKMETFDKFQIEDSIFFHMGRNNLYRINDLELNLSKLQVEVNKFVDGEIVIDSQQNNIYLAIWEKTYNEGQVKAFNNWLKSSSNGLHFVSKYKVLDYQDFLSGIKLDKELLRAYFRNL